MGIVVLPLALALVSGATSPIQLTSPVVQGKRTTVVSVQLNDPRTRVEVGLAAGFPGTDESFESMVKRMRPTVSVNGAYFDKFTLKPIGDIWQEGTMLNRGLRGTAFCLRSDKSVVFRRVEMNRGQNWTPYRTVLACGPALILDGRKDVDARGEGFGDYVIAPAPRMGVGVTSDQRLLLVHVRDRVTFEQFAEVMAGLGCTGAMNLDAGASLAMYAQGKYLLKPGRRLTNVINVFVD